MAEDETSSMCVCGEAGDKKDREQLDLPGWRSAAIFQLSKRPSGVTPVLWL